MTGYYKFFSFPAVSHRALCLAQSSSLSTQNLFLTWVSAIQTPLGLGLLRTTLNFKALALVTVFSLQNSSGNLFFLRYQDLNQGWKINWTVVDKTDTLLISSSSKLFPVSKPTAISVRGSELSFSSSDRNLGFCITSQMTWARALKDLSIFIIIMIKNRKQLKIQEKWWKLYNN